MHFAAEPPVLHLSGRVTPEDWVIWEEAMARYRGQLDTVVFHNSPGGNAATGRKIGESIRREGLRTVVAGRCRSACASMFLGGKDRHFNGPPGDAVLGYHGNYNKVTKQVNYKNTGEYYVRMTDGRMSEEVIAKFIRLESNKGFLFMVHPEQRKRSSLPLAYLCKGEEDTRNFDGACESVKEVSALSTGVVTSWQLVPVPRQPRVRDPKAATSKNWE